jgi:hypothetical protein
MVILRFAKGHMAISLRLASKLVWVTLFGFLFLNRGISRVVAQQKSIRVGPTISVSADRPSVSLGETWLAGNPVDPNNMIAVSMAFPQDGRWASVMYYTTDAGKSWQPVTHGPSHDAYFWGADPVVAFAPDGTAFYSDLEWGDVSNAPFNDDRSSASTDLATYVYRSTDGGRSWSVPTILDGTDHSCIAIDASRGKYSGRVYVAYTTPLSSAQGKATEGIGFAYSDDRGITYKQRVFSPPEVSFKSRIRIGPSPTDLLVTPDGVVVLPYIFYLKPESATADQDQFIQQTWVMTSADGGRTFSEPHLIVTSEFSLGPHSKNKIPSWPRMAIDASTRPTRDRLYVTNEGVANNRVRITVLSSSDMGQTWGPAVQVNDDKTERNHSTPGLAVSENGIVGVSWYDRREDPSDNCFQEYYSASLNGGVTFLPNVAVRQPATCPMSSGNWQPNVTQTEDGSDGKYNVTISSPGPRFANGGETQGIIGMAGGKFHLAWINGESGTMQLASTAIEVSAPPLGQDVGDLLDVKISQPAIDMTAHSLTMRLQVTNRSSKPMAAPLTLVLTRMESLLEGLHAVNSSNGLPGVGATWRLAVGSGETSLQPKESSAAITLKFEFTKVPGESSDTAPLDADFHFFEN